MEIITICQRKGGTGKTQTVLNIGAGLHRQGKRILFIDLDSQANLTKNLRIDPEQIEYSVYDVLTGTSTADEAIVETTEGSLLPASAELSVADIRLTGRGKEYRLRDALQPILSRYDFAIVDTPPALGTSLVNALTASDSAIITAEARKSSLDGIGELYGTLEAVRKVSNRSLQIIGILITRYRPRTILSRDMRGNLERVADKLNTKVFQAEIRECNAVAEAEFVNQSIFEYAPRSNAAKDYGDLIEEIQRGDTTT